VDGEMPVGAAEIEEDGGTVGLLRVPQIEERLDPPMQGTRWKLVGLTAKVGSLHREMAAEDQVESVD
jgi:hypothetical protein